MRFYDLRVYQRDAVESVIESIRKGKQKFLLSLATGTGKSIVVLEILKYLLEQKLVQKVIYLNKRKELRYQIVERFNHYLPQYNHSIDVDMDDAHFFACSPRKLLTNDKYKSSYTSTDKIFLIVDDIESISTGLVTLINYFKGYLLGTTSAGDNLYNKIASHDYSLERNKYNEVLHFFELKEPTFSYSLKQAVQDGYLLNPFISNDIQYDSFESIYNEISNKATNFFIHSKIDTYQMSEFNNIMSLLLYANDSLKETQDLLSDSLKSKITKEDIKSLSYKKEQLLRFESLLADDEFFELELSKHSGPESVWQRFFEQNKWIFGYGLSCIITDSFENKKLEQVVAGFHINQHGKRADAVLKTRGLISSLCFAEIKTHRTPLLAKDSYRPSCFSVSDEVVGGIAQVHKTVHSALYELKTKIEIKNKNGDPTGEEIFNYNPKSYLVVGNLNEFRTPHGTNEPKYSSFELFRRSVSSPEIITFDELYERARFIIENIS